MCTIFSREPELKIAEKDIEVIKYTHSTTTRKVLFIKRIITRGFYYDKVYMIGKTYRNILIKPRKFNDVWLSSSGLYSYSDYLDIEDKIDNVNIFRSIIPKGSKYYYSSLDGVYISNKLKLVMTNL